MSESFMKILDQTLFAVLEVSALIQISLLYVLFKRQCVDFWTFALCDRSMQELICSTRRSVIRCMWPFLKC